MGRVHSNSLYFTRSLFLSLSLSLCDFASSFRSTLHVLLRLPSRDRNPRYARFASTPRPIICCFRSTIFDRPTSGIERLKARSDKSAETVFFNSLISFLSSFLEIERDFENFLIRLSKCNRSEII